MRKYKQIEAISRKQYRNPSEFESMKEFAEYTKDQQYPTVLFKMKDNKDYSEFIWKTIKPEYSRPFKQEEDSQSK